MEFRRVLFRSGHAFEDRVDSGLCRTFAVSVLDAQQELATVTLGVQIREQRSARGPDVEKTGRARREAGDDTHEDKSQWTAVGKPVILNHHERSRVRLRRIRRIAAIDGAKAGCTLPLPDSRKAAAGTTLSPLSPEERRVGNDCIGTVSHRW